MDGASLPHKCGESSALCNSSDNENFRFYQGTLLSNSSESPRRVVVAKASQDKLGACTLRRVCGEHSNWRAKLAISKDG